MFQVSERKRFTIVFREPGGRLGWLRGACGGMISILVAGAIGSLLFGTDDPTLPWLVAPIGASAVLVFAVPASPLAQPWPVIGGNLVSAMVGLLVSHVVAAPLVATSLALGLSIGMMSVMRCLHPPGGACALLYALGASAHEPWSVAHVLAIAANVIAVAGIGWVYNNATGHSWPHRPAPVPTSGALHARSAAVHEALTAVLAEWNEVIDADVEDLDAIFLAVERRVRSDEADAPTC